MRIIAGNKKGHKLSTVSGKETRPTTDKIKGALFSIIGPYFDGGKVLDLFAGSGSLGIEALSRGADHAVFVDCSAQAVRVIQANLTKTKLSTQADCYRNDFFRAVKQLASAQEKFDFIFLDPPYCLKQLEKIIRLLTAEGLIAEGGIIVAESDGEEKLPEMIGNNQLIRRVTYGVTTLTMFQLKEKEVR